MNGIMVHVYSREGNDKTNGCQDARLRGQQINGIILSEATCI